MSPDNRGIGTLARATAELPESAPGGGTTARPREGGSSAGGIGTEAEPTEAEPTEAEPTEAEPTDAEPAARGGTGTVARPEGAPAPGGADCSSPGSAAGRAEGTRTRPTAELSA